MIGASLRGRANPLCASDDQGRFSVPKVAAGRLSIWPVLADESRYGAVSIEGRDLIAGTRATIEIPLKRLIRVHGIVREQGSGKPIEGAGVCISFPGQIGALRFVQSDSRGRYEAPAMPGSTSYLHLSEPKAYLKRSHGIETAIGERDGQAIPPVELVRGETLRGVVVDDHGKPVAGAKVHGKWDRIIGPGPKGSPGVAMGANYSALATSDARGEFVLEGIHKGASVMLEASSEEARTESPQHGVPAAPEPVKLVISGSNTVALLGHVVDADGKPITGALIQIRSRTLGQHSRVEAHPIRFSEGEIRSDSEGRFRTPRAIHARLRLSR